jgi:hypothetical protein
MSLRTRSRGTHTVCLLNEYIRFLPRHFLGKVGQRLRRVPDIPPSEWRIMLRTIRNSAFLCVLAIGAVATTQARVPAGTKPVTVEIKNADGKTVGTATLAQATEGVKITLDIKSLPPGAHLLHIHQFPKCEAPDFKSAGPHFDPDNTGHGEHSHAGLPAGIFQISC